MVIQDAIALYLKFRNLIQRGVNFVTKREGGNMREGNPYRRNYVEFLFKRHFTKKFKREMLLSLASVSQVSKLDREFKCIQ